MLVEVKIDAGSLKLLDRVEQVNERTAEPVNRPDSYNVKPSLLGLAQQRIQPWPGVAPWRR